MRIAFVVVLPQSVATTRWMRSMGGAMGR